MQNSEVNLGMFGLGNIGSWVLDQINNHYDANKTGVRINVRKIAVRDKDKARKAKVNSELLTTDSDEILNDPQIDTVLIAVSDDEFARKLILESFKCGKDVITANKVLAEHGQEIFSAARKYERRIGYQATVGGEMQILNTLMRTPYKIKALVGILNGTSNFILTRMAEGKSYEDALKLAQELGFAEPNPASDVEGIDAARKLAIATMISINSPVTSSQVYREPVNKVTGLDIAMARRLLKVDRTTGKEYHHGIKYVAVMMRQEDGIVLGVYPALVAENHPLASVNEENNAILVFYEDREEPRKFIGKGAGSSTAGAIITDIVEIAKKRNFGIVDAPSLAGQEKILSPSEHKTSFYLRLHTANVPGSIHKITGVLAKHRLNIASVNQAEEAEEGADMAPLAIKTYPAEGRHVSDALKELEDQNFASDMLPIRILE